LNLLSFAELAIVVVFIVIPEEAAVAVVEVVSIVAELAVLS